MMYAFKEIQLYYRSEHSLIKVQIYRASLQQPQLSFHLVFKVIPNRSERKAGAGMQIIAPFHTERFISWSLSDAAPRSAGKSSLASSVLTQFDVNKYTVLPVNMSAQTTSNNVQAIIESRMEKRTKNVYVPQGGTNCQRVFRCSTRYLKANGENHLCLNVASQIMFCVAAGYINLGSCFTRLKSLK